MNSIDRRVLGVLGEKAKTTPDTYPMSLNGVVAGCNQKSNRSPVMQLEPDQVEESLDRLRQFGAVALVEGSGRVQKYLHYLYEWLGVSKVELSVMIELLLRGPQTEGELRGRVSRMDPIDDLNALRDLLTALRSKGLVLPLTPEGRGQVFTHALFPQRDLDHQKAQVSQQTVVSSPVDNESHVEPPPPTPARPPFIPSGPGPAPIAGSSGDPDLLRQTVEQLRSQVKRQQQEIDDLTAGLRRIEDEFQDLKRALGN
ncbi:MAG: DUF480 domain-containing protein [Thermoguttaceae bacterium]